MRRFNLIFSVLCFHFVEIISKWNCVDFPGKRDKCNLLCTCIRSCTVHTPYLSRSRESTHHVYKKEITTCPMSDNSTFTVSSQLLILKQLLFLDIRVDIHVSSYPWNIGIFMSPTITKKRLFMESHLISDSGHVTLQKQIFFSLIFQALSPFRFFFLYLKWNGELNPGKEF